MAWLIPLGAGEVSGREERSAYGQGTGREAAKSQWNHGKQHGKLAKESWPRQFLNVEIIISK